MKSIYLDYAATTPIHPDVQRAMMQSLEEDFGNPSSIHRAGRSAKQAVEDARSIVAKALGAKNHEIIFTSGGTESDVLALTGILMAGQARHMVTTSIEHHAVLHTCDWLADLGYEITYVAPQNDGSVLVEDMLHAVRSDTGLISMMWVNNETGAVQPVAELAQALVGSSVYLHTDAVQAIGSLAVNVKDTPVAALSLSGHKLFGPKGIGALYLRSGTPFRSIINGGTQEKNRRAGTENIASIIGLSHAINLTVTKREEYERLVCSHRDRFLQYMMENLDCAHEHRSKKQAGHILNIRFDNVPADLLLIALDLEGVFASAGSACTAGSIEPSHVLVAMGLSDEEVRSSVRFSFSPFVPVSAIERAATVVIDTVKRLRHIL